MKPSSENTNLNDDINYNFISENIQENLKNLFEKNNAINNINSKNDELKNCKLAFVGLSTLDHIWYVKELPEGDGKIRATDYQIEVGGMAANAAITAKILGADVHLLSYMADDSSGQIIEQKLTEHGLHIEDYIFNIKNNKNNINLENNINNVQSAISAVMIANNGERMIVNRPNDFLKKTLAEYSDIEHQQLQTLLEKLLNQANALELDTRWPAAGLAALKMAKKLNIPSVMDIEKTSQDVLKPMLIDCDYLLFSKTGLLHFSQELIASWLFIAKDLKNSKDLHNINDINDINILNNLSILNNFLENLNQQLAIIFKNFKNINKNNEKILILTLLLVSILKLTENKNSEAPEEIILKKILNILNIIKNKEINNEDFINILQIYITENFKNNINKNIENSKNLGIIAVTMAEHGAYYLDLNILLKQKNYQNNSSKNPENLEHPFKHMPAYPVIAVDTNGAGDAFHGAFAWGLANFKTANIAEIFAWASYIAAEKCKKQGRIQIDAVQAQKNNLKNNF